MPGGVVAGCARSLVAGLLLPTAAAEWTLFTDVAGEVETMAGPDLLDAKLMWQEARPGLICAMRPD
jgi:hypothetical protein